MRKLYLAEVWAKDPEEAEAKVALVLRRDDPYGTNVEVTVAISEAIE